MAEKTDGWARDPDGQSHDLVPGPFTITNMPADRPPPPPRPSNKLTRGVAGPGREDK